MRVLSPISIKIICFYLFSINGARADDAVAFVRPISSKTDWGTPFCIDYNPKFHDLPSTKSQAVSLKITDLSKHSGCNDTSYISHDANNSVVLVARGNCPFTIKAEKAQNHLARGILIASDELLTPAATNETIDYQEINITVAIVLWKNAIDIRNLMDDGTPLEILMYAPIPDTKFDPCMVVLFLIAVSIIVLGGYWAGVSKHAKYQKLKYKEEQKKSKAEADDDGETADDKVGSDDDDDDDDEDDSVDVSLPVIVVFFVLVCAFLLLLYFFFDYLVYVVIALFCLAGAMGLYACLCPTWKRILPLKYRLPPNRIPLLRDRPEYRSLLLLAVCLSVGIFWGVQRHASYAWVIQDILGFVFCLNVMKTVSVPNMKVCTIMLSLLFVYDVFFVFITPYFTSNGESVMVKVATGGDGGDGGHGKTHEQLPMVFKVPRLARDDLSVCPIPFSLLGFGDIILPGLLVAHNHVFDLKVQSHRIYFIATSVAYAVGLVITFVALALMQTGQPALMYLVPCTLVTTFLIGLKRGEVRLLWSGYKEQTNDDTSGDIQQQSSTKSIDSISSSGTDNESCDLLKRENKQFPTNRIFMSSHLHQEYSTMI